MTYMHWFRIINKFVALNKFFVLIVFFACAINVGAQKRKHFSPERFEAELEQFITINACLSPQEASQFFPLYREMRKKQRAYFGEERRYRNIDTSDDKACADAIRRHDSNDMEMKKLQRDYHEKFMNILPASKVFRIIKSEDKFHRQIFKRATKSGGHKN